MIFIARTLFPKALPVRDELLAWEGSGRGARSREGIVLQPWGEFWDFGKRFLIQRVLGTEQLPGNGASPKEPELRLLGFWGQWDFWVVQEL